MTLLAAWHLGLSVCILLYIRLDLPRPMASAALGLCPGLERGYLPSLQEVALAAAVLEARAGSQNACISLHQAALSNDCVLWLGGSTYRELLFLELETGVFVCYVHVNQHRLL